MSRRPLLAQTLLTAATAGGEGEGLESTLCWPITARRWEVTKEHGRFVIKKQKFYQIYRVKKEIQFKNIQNKTEKK